MVPTVSCTLSRRRLISACFGPDALAAGGPGMDGSLAQLDPGLELLGRDLGQGASTVGIVLAEAQIAQGWCVG
jgi:hypothetical protein